MHDMLNDGGKLVGLLFDRDFQDGPPFGGNKEEYLNYFSPLFNIKIFEKCYNSIEPRMGSELFIILEKK
jgi:thiopurine S-methyltransferase